MQSWLAGLWLVNLGWSSRWSETGPQILDQTQNLVQKLSLRVPNLGAAPRCCRTHARSTQPCQLAAGNIELFTLNPPSAPMTLRYYRHIRLILRHISPRGCAIGLRNIILEHPPSPVKRIVHCGSWRMWNRLHLGRPRPPVRSTRFP